MKLYGGLLSMLGRLPLKFLYHIGDFISWIFNRLIQYRKSEVYVNLSRSFPEYNYRKIRETADGFYKHLGEIIAETIWFAGCKGRPERVRKQNIYKYENTDMLLNLREKRGIICMRSHMGNWEISGGIYEYNREWKMEERLPQDCLFVAYRPLRNAVSDQIFYNNRGGVLPGYKGMIKDTELLRNVIKNKDKNPVYMVIADQFPYMACHHVGNFLNQPTEGMLGAFSLAHKLGLAVVTSHESRDGRGKYRCSYEILSEDASKDNPEELMRLYFAKLEEDIRKDPANWLWSHRRWHYAD